MVGVLVDGGVGRGGCGGDGGGSDGGDDGCSFVAVKLLCLVVDGGKCFEIPSFFNFVEFPYHSFDSVYCIMFGL